MKSEIFQYSWTHKDMPSVTKVDLAFSDEEELRQAHPYLLTLQLYPRGNPASDKMGRVTRFRMQRLINKVKKKTEGALSIWVGEHSYGSVTELFFYGESEVNLKWLADMAEVKYLANEAEFFFDKEWTVYFQKVCPSAAQQQAVKNRVWIERIKKSGDDVVAPRKINHHLSFFTESDRVKFEGVAKQAGFALGGSYFAPEAAMAYGVVVHQRATLDLSLMDASTSKLIQAAEPYRGNYEYWDCALVPKR